MSTKDKYIPSYPLSRDEFVALRGLRQKTDMPQFNIAIFLEEPMLINRLEALGFWEVKKIIHDKDTVPEFRMQITELGRKVLAENEETIWPIS